MQHQMMGYDRTSTMFSPDGRLLQVEYAKKTVKQGSTAIGLVCKDGVVLVADKRHVERLLVSGSIEKIYQVDEHIGATSTGLVMDGRVLIERAQLLAQQHRVTYDTPVDILSLVKDVADIKQAHTQYGGGRPFGVSILFAGVNDRPELYMTDPTGIYFEYKATAIGEAEGEVKDILEKNYKETLTIEDGLRLAVRALKKVLGKDYSVDRIDGAYVSVKDRALVRVPSSKIGKIS
ncbi:archaeal proteasome endopeptidase complex subunit alpha [Candidatus Woesearchaeota archaeon]|nr:archaeal proteasome endopeptidase complex subunit alpha [Candidatus Woesearchaeota archaeon]